MQRGDPCTPGFVVTVIRTMVLFWLVGMGGSLVVMREAFWGMTSGGAIALCAFLLVMHTGRQLSPTARYARLMLGLHLRHLLLWSAMAVLLAVLKVHPLGFLIGASVLPLAILAALAWYRVRYARLSP